MNKGAPPSLVYLLGVAHVLETRLENELAAAGLSIAKLGLLRTLADAREPLALSEVAERVRCVRSNVTQLVDRLEQDGLVRRVDDTADRRIRRAALTTAGHQLYKAGNRVLLRVDRAVTRALTKVDAAALARALGRLGS